MKESEGTIANTRTIPVMRFVEHKRNPAEATVVTEFPLTIILNGQEVVTLLCSPADLKYLATGFLFAEGFIHSKKDIKKIAIDDRHGLARITTEGNTEFEHKTLLKRLITSAGGRGAAFYSAAGTCRLDKVESQTTISANKIFSLVDEFNQCSRLFKATGGVHGAALSDGKSILVFSDDLGRHNAIDKVFGKCILEEIPTEGRIIITSGRTPSEMIFKAGNGKVPILISISAPSDLGVRLAGDLGITLVGFVRGKNMTVYTNDWRIKD
ncbi:MAG: formate dehydrogenase accessory sulfurtransferase FdhD [Dehalococcoidales bacterium]|nr:formate dehydrogenase accessory sulfurtransferase FdhD [Dehalococcoidales bacterium]